MVAIRRGIVLGAMLLAFAAAGAVDADEGCPSAGSGSEACSGPSGAHEDAAIMLQRQTAAVKKTVAEHTKHHSQEGQGTKDGAETKDRALLHEVEGEEGEEAEDEDEDEDEDQPEDALDNAIDAGEFKAIDTNGNGVLEFPEVKASVMKATGGTVPGWLQPQFTKADKDGSGTLSIAEFIAAGAKYNALLQTNVGSSSNRRRRRVWGWWGF